MKKPEKGMITHQDTDETVVLGVLSAVILFFTILTIGSYAETQTPLTEQNLITENTLSTQKEQKQDLYLIKTSNTKADNDTDQKNIIQM